MYRAYKLPASPQLKESLLCEGETSDPNVVGMRCDEIHKRKQKRSIKSTLRNFVKKSSFSDDTVNADSIWDEWFPNIRADVFISHSTKDVDLAKQLSCWLKTTFDLTAFIDSEIWDHADDLLKEIDDEYCLHEN